jgi:hypothetical protein
MDEILMKTGEAVGHIYFLFILVLVVTNSLAIYIIDRNNEFETRLIVGMFSFTNVIVFSFFDADIGKLIIYTFATFGVFSFFGKAIEKMYMYVFLKLYNWILQAVDWIKNKFNFTK